MHPVNVESVAWISQRKNVMAMLFFLLSILWYVKYAELARLRLAAKLSTVRRPLPAVSSFIFQPSSFYFLYWLSLAAFILAMLSKGSVAVLPAMLLMIVWWLRPLTRRDMVWAAPFFAVAIILTGVNVWFQTHGTEVIVRNAGFSERLLGAGGVVWFYLYKALLPFHLAFIYPQWVIQALNPLWWLPLLATVSVTGALWRYRKSWGRPLLFAWGFFCVSLLPVMGFTDVGFMKYSLVANHYQHISLIGVITLVAAGWGLWRQRVVTHWAATAVAVAAVGISTFLVWQQSRTYHDSIMLYQATLDNYPECWVAHNHLGISLAEMGQLQEAMKHCQRALQIKPDYPGAHNTFGIALFKAGRLTEAIEHYEKALQINPNYADAHVNLGVALIQTNRPKEAIEHIKLALRLKPNFPEAYNNLGSAFEAMGLYQQAIEYYKVALQLKPDYPEAHTRIAGVLIQMGRPKEGMEHYRQALRLNPDFAEAHVNLGVALFNAGLLPEAIEHYEKALQIDPKHSDAHNDIGGALIQTDRPEEAIEHIKQALRLKPDFPDALNNLGVALVQIGRPEEAIEQFKQALRLKPDYISAYNNLAEAYAKMHQSSEAVASAQKAIELARSQGQTTLARQIEDWLKSYRTNLPNPPNAPLPSKSAPVP
jgi:tetratricopeptide (TPR) repeat protein